MTPFHSLFNYIQYCSHYSRFREDLGRREQWDETVTRVMDFLKAHLQRRCDYTMSDDIYRELYQGIYNHEVMPSMRLMWTAGPAAERDESAAYNCSMVAIDSPRSFDEVMYNLMLGTGVGFSVQSKYISQLPEVPPQLYPTDTTIVVSDSRTGWAKATRELLNSLWYSGTIPNWDMSKIRPKGARLKTFGGTASGSGPLEDLFQFIVRTFQNAPDRRLNSLEVHDILCMIAECVVSGGTRRSATLSLSDLYDDLMRNAKSGDWYRHAPYRALANNSAAYEDPPTLESFMHEWENIWASKSGERGIFNLHGARKRLEAQGERDGHMIAGTNPCGEILLRDAQMCNLSSNIIRHDDTWESIAKKARLATILGTFQSTLTNFRYLRKKWQQNCEEERLLGVSMTGIMDNPLLSQVTQETANKLGELREYIKGVNRTWADKLGIERSVARTCIKPEGTVSSVMDTSSGIHCRYAPYYKRRVILSNTDPICQFLRDKGFAFEESARKPGDETVFVFGQKAPEQAKIFAHNIDPVWQLKHWQMFQQHYTDHSVSASIYVKEDNWLDVGSYVWKNKENITGCSFFPHDDNVYVQQPFEAISESEYDELMASTPSEVDWEELTEYEKEDMTTGAREYACVGGQCEI